MPSGMLGRLKNVAGRLQYSKIDTIEFQLDDEETTLIPPHPDLQQHPEPIQAPSDRLLQRNESHGAGKPRKAAALFGGGCLRLSARSAVSPDQPSARSKAILSRLARHARPAAAVSQQPQEQPQQLTAIKRKPDSNALHRAAWRTNIAELAALVAGGSDVNKCDRSGMTPLHFASWQGSVDSVELLIQAGAKVNAADAEGLLPIHFASWFNRLDVVALLIDRGSFVNAPAKERLLLALWPSTPLIYAAKCGHVDTVALLMSAGADVAGSFKSASSALHEAAFAGHAGVVQEILSRGISHSITTEKHKYTALHLAAMKDSAATVQVLLAAGADPDARSQDGRTALMMAAEKGAVSAAAALLDGGADLLLKDQAGFTALHLAVDFNHLQLATLLLDRGTATDAVNRHGALPLHFAHNPDLHKLLRTIGQFGAACVPSTATGPSPKSSRLVSGPAVSEPAATPASAVPAQHPRARPVPAATSWLERLHLARIRAPSAAAAAAVRTPRGCGGSQQTSGVEPQEIDVSSTGGTGAGASIVNRSPSRASSTGSAAAGDAAAAMARAAVEAVVARAAVDAEMELLLETEQQRPSQQQHGRSLPGQDLTDSLALTSAATVRGSSDNGSSCSSRRGHSAAGCLSPDGGVDDVQLLQQVKQALAGQAAASCREAAAAPGTVCEVALDEFLRQPGTVSVTAKRPAPLLLVANEDAQQIRNSVGDQAGKQTTTEAAAAASATAVSAERSADDLPAVLDSPSPRKAPAAKAAAAAAAAAAALAGLTAVPSPKSPAQPPHSVGRKRRNKAGHHQARAAV